MSILILGLWIAHGWAYWRAYIVTDNFKCQHFRRIDWSMFHQWLSPVVITVCRPTYSPVLIHSFEILSIVGVCITPFFFLEQWARPLLALLAKTATSYAGTNYKVYIPMFAIEFYQYNYRPHKILSTYRALIVDLLLLMLHMPLTDGYPHYGPIGLKLQFHFRIRPHQ